MSAELSDKWPKFLRERFAGRSTLRSVLGNSVWLFADQLLRMVLGLITGVWMARYLGPAEYGWLNYAVALVAVVGSLTSLGTNAVVVRELVQSPNAEAGWFGAALFLRAAGSFVGLLICLLIALTLAMPVSGLVLIVAVGLIFQVPDVVDLLLQARGKARISAWVRMTACIVSSGMKLVLLATRAPLLAFAAATVFETALVAAGWWWAVRRQGRLGGERRHARAYLAPLLRESWPLALSGLAISAQAYADQLILGAMLGGNALGQYAAAMRIVSVFAFVPMVIQTAAAPEIARAKQADEVLYLRRLHDLYRAMLGAFVLTAGILVLLGPTAAAVLFGKAYADTSALLPLLALRLYFTSFGVARSIFIINAGLFRFSLVTALVGAVVNVVLNLILIPRWGAIGALVASLFSFAVTTFGLDAFEPRARENLKLMLRASFIPWQRFMP